MCGIFGAFGSNVQISNRIGFGEPNLDDEVLSHRGPDDYGCFRSSYYDTDVYLDHTRLSIIGLGPQGHQPFCSKDESIALTYNGEIYNYKSLKSDLLENFGCNFETQTDTEVLLRAYQTWGLEKTLSELVGMFAFGIADLNRGIGYVVRDQLGVKPVYYYSDNNTLLFASEIKALLQKGELEARLNQDMLGEYLANFWVYEPDTLFEGIYKLEAGHYLTYNLNTKLTKKTQYWDIIEDGGDGEAYNIDKDIETVIQDQLVSDVPLGMYLSGGVDSSIIAYHATQDHPLEALNLRNDTGAGNGEYKNIERLKEELDIKVESISPDASMLDVYREMIYHMDEPIGDSAIIPANLLARAAREQDTKVMLSGMGGDEIFAGYRRMHIIANLGWLQYLSPIFSLLDRFFPRYASRFRRNIRQIANFLDNPSPSNYFSLSNRFSRDEITELTEDEEWHYKYTQKIRKLLSGKEFIDDAQRYQYLDIRGYLASHNLIYMDKTSMAESVEVRVPLLDHRFAGRYFNIPTEKKVEDGLKTPLKRHLSNTMS